MADESSYASDEEKDDKSRGTKRGRGGAEEEDLVAALLKQEQVCSMQHALLAMCIITSAEPSTRPAGGQSCQEAAAAGIQAQGWQDAGTD